MKILIDTRIYLDYTGLGSYIRAIIASLSCDNRFEVFTYGSQYFDNTVNIFTKRSAWINSRKELNNLVKLYSLNLYISPHLNYYHVRGVQNVAVIHDLTPLIVREYLGRFRYIKRMYILFFLRNQFPKADRILTVSENTKMDILGRYSYENIKVCYPGDPLINKGYSDRIRNQFIYVGDSKPHKNIQKMLEIWSSICQDGIERKLLLIGNLSGLGIVQNNITVLGHVNDETLDRLYWESEGLFFLSENEGFGFPIVEASNRNTKCIIYNKSSLREIAKDENTYRISNLNEIDLELLRDFMDKDITYSKELYSEYNWNNINNFLAH
jgi:glycosyltransferase involved in cell wall biosynthesis